MHRFRDVLFRVFTFTGRDPDHFRTLEGKARHHEDAEDGGTAADERCVSDRPVDKAGRFPAYSEDKKRTDDEKGNNRNNLDACKKKLAFAV